MDSPTNTGAGVVKMTICLADCEEAIFLLRDIPRVLLGKTYFDLHFNVIKNIGVSLFYTINEIVNLKLILDIKC